MKYLLALAVTLLYLSAEAQIDTANYLTKPVPAIMRTDTFSNNLITYNQSTHKAELMSGKTLTDYFRKGLVSTSSLGAVAFNNDYNSLSNKPAIPSSVTLTAGNGILITGTFPNFTVSVVQPTLAFPTRTINTNFTPSATKAALVYYSVLCQVSNPLLAGNSSATVTLQYSTNAGSSWQDVAQIGNLSSVALAVAIQITNGQTGELFGIVPANALVRLNSVTAGTASVSVTKSTEIVY